MSILPDVERALIGAAYDVGRHSRKRAALVALTVLASVLVLAAVLVAALPAIRTQPTHREAAQTPTPSPTPTIAPQVTALAARTYSVFAGERDAARDALPARMRHSNRGRVAWYYDYSRLIADRGGYRVYAVPGAIGNTAQLCTVVVLPSGGGGGGCAPMDQGRPRTHWASITVSDGRHVFAAILPDGAVTAELTLGDGSVIRQKVQQNGVILGPTRAAVSATWLDSTGQRDTDSLDGISR
jgi:energy-converting hydrogenase Eha subunit A